MNKARIVALITTLSVFAPWSAAQELKPTVHTRLPAELSQYWLAPGAADLRAAQEPAIARLQEAIKFEVDSNFARALSILTQPSVQQGPLADYAAYYQGFAELRLGRNADARQTFEKLAARPLLGFLAEGVALRRGEVEEALGDHRAALAVYERLSQLPATAPDDVLTRVGRAAKASGDPDKAVEAYSRVLYEFPFGDHAAAAALELESLPVQPLVVGGTRYKLELGRAERLFGVRRYSAARPIYDTLRRGVLGDDRELMDLRIAECDYFMKHARAAHDALKPYTEKASRQAEAMYFSAVAARELGDHGEYLNTVRRIADEFPDQSWAEEALNNLATHYILLDEDDQAAATFREMVEKFPSGHYGDRAAWKFGWWSYMNGHYEDTIKTFEAAAVTYPRSDYRPGWLYWAARSHDALKDQPAADARYLLVATDYLNSYYGRLSVARLAERGFKAPQRRLVADPSTPADDGAPPPAVLPPNETLVRTLLAAGLYDQGLDELRYAQRAWGDSAAIQATFGWIYNRQGDLRAGINAMKRAYPQYLAAGGEQMPIALQKIRFPIDYWPLIQRYATENDLDPYMVAALINQESTFDAGVRSHANAYGLMQLLPATGRQYARTLQLSRRFTLSMLTTADTNLKMGTAYFSDLVKRYGGAHYALATYNAGPSRVVRWKNEYPGVDRDEFIDNIPYAETQDYVKKIIGQAEDYRRLYGPGAPASDADDEVKPVVTTKAKPPAPAAVAPPKASPGKATAKKKPAAKAPAKKSTSKKRAAAASPKR